MTSIIISLAICAGASGAASRASGLKGAPSLAPFTPAASGRASALGLRALGFSASSRQRARLSSPRASDLLTSPASVFAPFGPSLLQAAPGPETVETFASDCTTPQTTFSLGDTVCAKVSGEPADGTRVLRRIVFAHPDGFVLHSDDISASTASYVFTLPSAEQASYFGFQIDNRGTWVVATVDADDAGLRALAPISVRDPQRNVADLQITKDVVTGRPIAGQNISYIIHVFNLGPDAAENVRFVDSPPSNTAFVSLVQNSGPSFNCETEAGITTCAGATLAKGQSAFFTAVYVVNPSVANGGEVSGTLAVASDTVERRSEDNGTSQSEAADNPTPPTCTISCPGNITQQAAEGQSGAVVTFDAPTTSGNCGGVVVSPESGSSFSIGSTAVTATTTAPGGQVSSCSFVVTVTPATDEEAPSVSCPGDISVPESSASSDSATVNYSVSATDNSGAATVTCSHPSGSSFPAGTTHVVCTAADPAGNTSSCEFNVEVTEVGCTLEAPPAPDVAQLPTITRSCSLTLLASDAPKATDSCGGSIVATTSDPLSYDTPGNYTIHWTYTDAAGHTATQDQTVVISPDGVAPVPDAPQLQTVTGECSATVTETPTATDNCGGAGIEGTTTDPLTYTTPGTHTVNWKFTDNAGNVTTQTQTVVVTDGAAPVPAVAQLPTVTEECSVTLTPPTANDACAGTIQATTNDPLSYTAEGTYTVRWTYTDAAGNTATQNQTVVINDTTAPVPNVAQLPTVTAECSATVSAPTATDACAGTITGTTNDPTTYSAQGTYTINWTYNDGRGNTSTQTQTVVIDDNTPPTLVVPNVTAQLPLNSPATSMAVGYPAPTTGDNCPGVVSVSYNPPSGSVFPVGTTTVTAVATDAAGNTTTKTFTVTVLFNFTGFFSPVNNLPTLNQVNAGRAVPVKFSLSGNKGLGVLAAGSPSSGAFACNESDPAVDVTGTFEASGNSFSYDAGSDQYNYVWKTEKAWAGTCRQLVIVLTDGTIHRANFKFK